MESEFNSNTSSSQTQQEGLFDFAKYFFSCMSHWYWFAISLIVCLAVGAYSVLTTPPVYKRSSSVMIKTDSRGRSISNDVTDFSSFGLVTSNTNVIDEMQAMSSNSTMLEVVKRLRLNVNYLEESNFYDKVLYGGTLPFTTDIIGLSADSRAAFDVDILSDSTVMLSHFVLKSEKFPKSNVIRCAPGDTVQTPVGPVAITPTFTWGTRDFATIHVSKSPAYAVARNYLNNFSAQMSSAGKNMMRQSSIILMSQTDVCISRAEDILNTILAVYNENWMQDKNQVATSTSFFINDRLTVIEQELASVDENISKYKETNLLPDIKEMSSAYFTETTTLQRQIQDLSNELYMANTIRDYLVNEENKFQVIPSYAGISKGSGASLESQISVYNGQLAERTRLIAGTSEKNPLVLDLNATLAAQRQAIIIAIDNHILSLQTQKNNLENTESKTQAQLAASPTQAKYLQDVERQQKVKESLYLFLLQKREENELSQAFTPYNTRVIDPPGGSSLPIEPKKMQIILLAFIIGLCIPLGILYLMQVTDTAIHSKKDLNKITIPFLGEIPMAVQTKKKTLLAGLRLKKDDKKEMPNPVVVKAGNRNYINEAFRVLRTNLEFITEGTEHNVIAMTSFNPGSGKSFTSINVAITLAIKEKKVLIIDGDFRHASMSSFINSPKRGFANYLGHQISGYRDLICQDEFYKHLSILPVGTLPPNPTELIATPEFAAAVRDLAKDYDYVLIDCPPIDIVADTHIIEKCADRTIFIIRAGLMQRNMLPELQKIYDEKRFKNMTLVLNGTEVSGGKYGSNFGYRYGYGGHNMSYYASDDEQKS